MDAKFTISDSDSEPSEEVEEAEADRLSGEQRRDFLLGPAPTTADLKIGASGRVRLNSESLLSTTSKDEELPAWGEGDDGASGDGAPFRGRSQSAPPALWAAKKYGRQLRRMSDEFDSWLDKGELRKVRSAGTAKQMHHSRSWWSYLFSHQETEVENSHHEGHSNRTE